MTLITESTICIDTYQLAASSSELSRSVGYLHALEGGTLQASHRKYQCLGFFGLAGDGGFCSSFTTDTVSIFTTRL